MEFGYHHASFAVDSDADSVVDAMVERARFLEDGGFGWLTLMDHFWQLQGVGRTDEPFVECYTGLSALATATDSMELSGLVTCPHYRNPAYLARAMASLDLLSGGRGVLGIGAGWYEDEYDAIGIEYPDPTVRVRQLRDVIRLCRAAWNDPSPVDYDGEYYDLDGFTLEPKPDEIPVLVGGGGEQLTLRATAEYADRWNIPGRDPETYAHKLDVIADHCDDLGREYEEITKTATLTTVIRDSTEAAHDAYEELESNTGNGPKSRDEFRGIVGTAAEAAELVETYRDLGVDTLQIRAPRNDQETLERFVDDVVPEF